MTYWSVDMLNLICTNAIQEGEPYLDDFISYTFNIGFCSEACRLISFTFGQMTDTTKLYSLSGLDLIQGHRVTTKLNCGVILL